MPRYHTKFSRKHETFDRLHSKLHIKIALNRTKWKPLEACFGFTIFTPTNQYPENAELCVHFRGNLSRKTDSYRQLQHIPPHMLSVTFITLMMYHPRTKNTSTKVNHAWIRRSNTARLERERMGGSWPK